MVKKIQKKCEMVKTFKRSVRWLQKIQKKCEMVKKYKRSVRWLKNTKEM